MIHQPPSPPAQKGIWRQEIGQTGSLRGVFDTLRDRADGLTTYANAADDLFFARWDLGPEDGEGYYRFISIRDRIFCGITDCTYPQERQEAVRDEGLVEFHFQIAGPARMSWDLEDTPDGDVTPAPEKGHPVHEATMLAFRCGQDVNYTVRFPNGSYRLLGIYVDPAVLRDSFGLDSPTARRLFNPPPGEIPLLERKISLEFVRALQEMWDIGFDGPRDLIRASAKLTQIICMVADALDSDDEAEAQSVSQRDLELFERARQMLATDFSKNYSASSLARELGTNATKLKSGFKFLYGTTIFEYRKKYRMDYALKLLAEDEMTIAEVSRAAGYKRQASFTSAFKLHFGFLPKTARTMQNGGQ